MALIECVYCANTDPGDRGMHKCPELPVTPAKPYPETPSAVQTYIIKTITNYRVTARSLSDAVRKIESFQRESVQGYVMAADALIVHCKVTGATESL